jgi:HAE1 family hydrophobic/amphiphilic exporter-1
MAVFFGMIASTCLVVVFVPSFYAVGQWLEERRKGKRAPEAGAESVKSPESAASSPG